MTEGCHEDALADDLPDELLAARREILSKSKLTTKDRTRLRAIEAEVGGLPALWVVAKSGCC